MALYINKEKNSLIFDEKDFDMNFNYLPQIVLALMELDENKPIHFAIELPKTPMLFVLYLRKVLQESDVDLRIYYKDNSEALRIALKGYGMEYRSLSEFPDIKEK
jgi:hypothetical protein